MRHLRPLLLTVTLLSLPAWAAAAPQAQDYKALVCLFMFGGNDGHNMVVPLSSQQYSAYRTARGALALQAVGVGE